MALQSRSWAVIQWLVPFLSLECQKPFVTLGVVLPQPPEQHSLLDIWIPPSSTRPQWSNGEHCFFPEDLWMDVKISTATFHLTPNTAFSHKGHVEISNAPGSTNFVAKKNVRGVVSPSFHWLVYWFILFDFIFQERQKLRTRGTRRLEDSKWK